MTKKITMVIFEDGEDLFRIEYGQEKLQLYIDTLDHLIKDLRGVKKQIETSEQALKDQERLAKWNRT